MHRSAALSVVGVLASLACHSSAHQLATQPVPRRSAEECVGVVAPQPADSDYRTMTRPMLTTQFGNNIPRKSPVYPVSARVHVSAAGKVDSVVSTNGDYTAANMLRMQLMSHPVKPAVYHGCAVAAWTFVDVVQ